MSYLRRQASPRRSRSDHYHQDSTLLPPGSSSLRCRPPPLARAHFGRCSPGLVHQHDDANAAPPPAVSRDDSLEGGIV